jgi:hypothetical protein
VLNAAKTGSLFAGAGPAVVRVNESHIRPGQWFTMEAIAKGNRIIIKVNGKTTTDYTDERRRFMVGRIALQPWISQRLLNFGKWRSKNYQSNRTLPPINENSVAGMGLMARLDHDGRCKRRTPASFFGKASR